MAYIWLLVFWSPSGAYMPYHVATQMGSYDTYQHCVEAQAAITKAEPKDENTHPWAWRCVKVPAKKAP